LFSREYYTDQKKIFNCFGIFLATEDTKRFFKFEEEQVNLRMDGSTPSMKEIIGYLVVKFCHFPAEYFFTAESAEVAE